MTGQTFAPKPDCVVYDDWSRVSLGDGTVSAANAYHTDAKTATLTTAAHSGTGRVVLHVGDSLTNAGTYPWYVREAFDGDLALTGLVDNVCLHEGHSGWQWSTFNSSGSPFFAGASLYVAGYLASLPSVPTHVIWMLGTNDIFGATYANLAATIATALGHADTLIAAFAAALPAVKQCVMLVPPGSSSHVSFEANYTGPTANQMPEFRAKQWAMNEALLAHFDPSMVANPCLWVDRSADYWDNNALHPKPIGYEHIAQAAIGWLANNW